MPFPRFKTKDEIPKGFESEYEEKDGEFIAKVPDTSKLEETISTLRKDQKAAEKSSKEFADKAADLQRKLDAKDASGADTDKKISELLAKWETDTATKVGEVQAKLDAKDAELVQIKLYDKAKDEFIKAGGRPEKADAALKLKRDSLDLADDRMVVKNEKGEVTTETVSDFWGKSFRKEMPEFFTGTKAAGGGAGGGAGFDPNKGTPTAGDDVIKNPLAALQRANEQAAAA